MNGVNKIALSIPIDTQLELWDR